MDQVKTGELIAQKRKELGLTQKQLAEELGVSDKTISKWECGKSMPDYSVIQSICQLLQISVSELLAGEILEEAEYKNWAEEKIMDLMEQNEKQDSGWRVFIGAAVGLALLSFAIGFVLVSAGGFRAIHYVQDVPTLLFLVLIDAAVLTLLRMHKNFWRGIRYFFIGKKEISKEELQSSIMAMKTMVVSTLLAGGIIFAGDVLIVGYNVEDLTAIGPALAVTDLSIFYACIVALFFYVAQMKMVIRLQKEE